MNNIFRFPAAIALIFCFVFSALPCGPSYVTPVFDYKRSPELPLEAFAAGRIGIIKPTYNRSVLLAAYRYVNGGGFTPEEQKGLTEVWRAEFDNKAYETSDTAEAVKLWLKKRAEVAGKEEKTPDIYVEREYGGYDFFPNCTANAFETATETLSERIAAHGADNKNVKQWLEAQDQVFTNCSSGRQIPSEADASMPEWLQKDRAYQLAAAEFYSLNYDSAKRRFTEIALDFDSPWQETADYLVARTLIRQASLVKSEEKATELYSEAERKLQTLNSNKFADSAERMLGLVKYRLRPQERVRELGQKLASQSGNPNFRQDLIDYTWLLDKFEKQTLETEEKRKEAENPKDPNSANSNIDANIDANRPNANTSAAANKENENELKIYLYTDDYQQNWTFTVGINATDEETVAEAERISGMALSDAMKKRVREARQTAYQNRYTSNRQNDYEGGYYGNEKTSLSILPAFLRYEDLTDWLFTYQIVNPESYLYSLSKFRETGADLWLMTALSKADKNSAELARLVQAGKTVSRSSAAYATIVYHLARIYIEQGKTAEARKLLDEILAATDDLPISSVNQFMELRLKLAETLDEFIRYGLRKPFAFDMGGTSGTIEDFIAEQKTWYNPEYDKQTREEYEREVEERFREEKKWENRLLFDADMMDVFNQHFPLAMMIEAEKSPALPEYLRENFAVAIWTKAVLLDDFATAAKIAPEMLKYKPEMQPLVSQIETAKTPLQKQNAVLYFILKNPVLTPFLESSLEKSDNEANSFDMNDWWCAPYDLDYDEETEQTVPAKLPPRPKFLSETQSRAAQAERQKLKDLDDAPKYLGEKVLAWARRAPADRRVPESLYIVYEANGWKKYSCGNNMELREEIGNLLKTRYPQSEWTRKITAEEQ